MFGDPAGLAAVAAGLAGLVEWEVEKVYWHSQRPQRRTRQAGWSGHGPGVWGGV